MREAYHDRLGELASQLADMCAMVATAMERATTALLKTDLALAEQVIGDDLTIDNARTEYEEEAYALLALQAPVATDLRTVLAVIHAAESLERMGDLALHVAKTTRRRHPNPVLPDEVRPYFEQMGRSPPWRWPERPSRSSAPRTSRWPGRSRRTTTRWTTCTGSCSRC